MKLSKAHKEHNDLLKIQIEKLKKNDKYIMNMLKEEVDSHSKTLNNKFKNFDLSEKNEKQDE